MTDCHSNLLTFQLCFLSFSAHSFHREWHSQFCSVLLWFTLRRELNINAWIDRNTAAWSDNADVQNLRTRTVVAALQQLRAGTTLCGSKCTHCQFQCIKTKHHDGDTHLCGGNHQCVYSCDFCHSNAEEKRALQSESQMSSLEESKSDADIAIIK